MTEREINNLAFLQLEMKIKEATSRIVTEVSLDKLKTLEYHSDEFTGSFFQQYLRLILSETEFPIYLASSVY